MKEEIPILNRLGSFRMNYSLKQSVQFSKNKSDEYLRCPPPRWWAARFRFVSFLTLLLHLRLSWASRASDATSASIVKTIGEPHHNFIKIIKFTKHWKILLMCKIFCRRGFMPVSIAQRLSVFEHGNVSRNWYAHPYKLSVKTEHGPWYKKILLRHPQVARKL